MGYGTPPDSRIVIEPVQQQIRAQLRESGLNLYACLDLFSVQAQGIGGVSTVADTAGQYTLVLVGNRGPDFWSACQASSFKTADHPVDEFSAASVLAALAKYAPETTAQLLYPAPECRVPLQQLGALVGWHQPSPLGTGIHPDWGLWFAYRALILVEAGWQPTEALTPASNVCAECASQACLQACPPSALSESAAPDLLACARYRVFGHENHGGDDAGTATESRCATTCLARCACPVAPSQRYTDDQINHHYSRALSALRHWVDPKAV